MQLQDFLQGLKGVKHKGGGQYQAQCPAHNDNDPSLSVREKDGKILLYCHVGCTADSILGVMGLEMKDLFAEERPMPDYQENNDKPKSEIVAVYDYKDLDGNIVHTTIRYNPKKFLQRRPDPASPGKYIWKKVFEGITPILYNLQAVHKAQTVFIVEGEKDCDNLAKCGFVATTSPMGAGKWRDSFSETLKGKMVYIIADFDPAGEKHAKTVAQSIFGKAEAVYMVTLPLLHEGADVSDFLENLLVSKRSTAIEGLMATATLYEADKEPPQEKIKGGGKPTPATMLMNLVEESGATFFHSDVKDLYAVMRVNNH